MGVVPMIRILLSLLTFTLLTSSALAVEKKKTVIEGGGGDYTTLEACLNANESDITAGAGTTFVASIEGAWTSVDASAVIIDGWTTSATYDITIVTNAAARADGKWNTGKYRLVPSAGAEAIACPEDYVNIEGIQIDATSAGDASIHIEGGSGIVRISYCIMQGGTSNIRIAHANTATYYIYNTICYDAGSDGIQVNAANTTVYIENVTVHNSGRNGVHAHSSSATIAVNVVVQDCVSPCFIDNFTSSSYNCSDDDTQPGTNGQNGEVTFENEGADDFHLGSGDTVAKDNGTSSVSSGHTDDIDGDTRSGSWDIGADEFVSAEPAAANRRQILLRSE